MSFCSRKNTKKILFIIPAQYGYHTDSYQYCEILSRWYDVTYLGVELGKKERISSNVHVHLAKMGSSITWRYNLFTTAYKLEKIIHFDVVFIYSFPLCSLFRLIFSKGSIIMDIRTSVIEGKYKSIILNRLIKLESAFFKRISVISKGVALFLELKLEKCKILPLGGKQLPYLEKNMSGISLLYVGTFYDRHIENTIDGVAMFMKKYPKCKISYTIIGTGSDSDKKKITDRINLYNCVNINYVGEKRHEELLQFLSNHNVGVSYIPLTDYYDCQPPTKTYEYLLSSMIVLATPTSENRKVINATNGILLQGDSAFDFAKGIENLMQVKNTFNFRAIYEDSQKYTWENVVKQYLIPIIEDTNA